MSNNQYRISLDIACIKALRKLPSKVIERFHEMVLKLMVDPSRSGLNIESIQGARDSAMRSLRIDQGYRAIGYCQGSDLLLLHVDEHDKAYLWGISRTVRINTKLNRIQILEGVPQNVPTTAVGKAKSDYHQRNSVPHSDVPHLFDHFTDDDLRNLGISDEKLPHIRDYQSELDLEADIGNLDATTYDILFSLAAGFSLDEVPELIAPVASSKTESMNFSDALRTDESRQEIFLPEDERELRRFLDGNLEGWRVFLHPEQRRIAYHAGYHGPVLVRGGAGTGKTVVAMHRAKHLADGIAAHPHRKGEKILFTTFTATLARDVKVNLKKLCPEHVSRADPVIQVVNLDRWVGDFLKRRGFMRSIVYFGEERDRLNQIWDEVLAQVQIPEGLTDNFIKDEWSQVVQAKGVGSEREYFATKRVGRGTPLDRRKRRALWTVFAAYRAKMVDERLAEPDDAYREAIAILKRERTSLSYTSVIVDEAQDMGEAALKLVRQIVPKTIAEDRNSLFIVGDAHQRIYARKSSMSSCGIEVRGRARRMRLNYRTTELIRRYAVSILEGVAVDDLDDSVDTLFGYRSLIKGQDPVRIGYKTKSDEVNGLVTWLQDFQLAADGLKSIAVLVRTNAQVGEIDQVLKAASIPTMVLRNNSQDNPDAIGIRIATMHRAKGLEFDCVAIALLSEENIPPRVVTRSAVDDAGRREISDREKSLLHVACTRARNGLRISWHGARKPTFLRD